jgi:hypothetical protein
MKFYSILLFAALINLFTDCQAMESKEQNIEAEKIDFLTLKIITDLKDQLKDLSIESDVLKTPEEAKELCEIFSGYASVFSQLASFFKSYQQKCVTLKGLAHTAELNFLTNEERIILGENFKKLHDDFMVKTNPDSPILEWGGKKYQNEKAIEK